MVVRHDVAGLVDDEAGAEHARRLGAEEGIVRVARRREHLDDAALGAGVDVGDGSAARVAKAADSAVPPDDLADDGRAAFVPDRVVDAERDASPEHAREQQRADARDAYLHANGYSAAALKGGLRAVKRRVKRLGSW